MRKHHGGGDELYKVPRIDVVDGENPNGLAGRERSTN